MKIRTTFTAAALSLLAFGAFAQTAAAGAASTPRVDQRQAKQEQRIDQGVANGSLTKKETKRLQHEQTRIDHVENRAKADGTVTNKEKARLHAMQKGAGHDIKHQKHDRQRAAVVGFSP